MDGPLAAAPMARSCCRDRRRTTTCGINGSALAYGRAKRSSGRAPDARHVRGVYGPASTVQRFSAMAAKRLLSFDFNIGLAEQHG